METLARYQSPPSRCGYLPEREWSLEYEMVLTMAPAEYMTRMAQGWRRFGHVLFHPQCPHCQACQSLRVPVATFEPNRSQRRAWNRNRAEVEIVIGEPSVDRARLDLYDRYHLFQSAHKGWPEHPAKDAGSYVESFVNHPFPTQEWCYFLGGRLIGVGYVDVLPQGMSAIYFFYEPRERHRSLGTYNVLCILEEARRRKLPHIYLGYFVSGCDSLEYKASFRPNQILGPDGKWRPFR